MWTGAKRKLVDIETDEIDYNQQCRIMFDMTVSKLHAPAIRNEIPLRRTVLIFNTLKAIETELNMNYPKRDVAWQPNLTNDEPPMDKYDEVNIARQPKANHGQIHLKLSTDKNCLPTNIIADSTWTDTAICDEDRIGKPVTPYPDYSTIDDMDSIFDLDLGLLMLDGKPLVQGLGDRSNANAGHCRKDLWSDELDNIMEILVSS